MRSDFLDDLVVATFAKTQRYLLQEIKTDWFPWHIPVEGVDYWIEED